MLRGIGMPGGGATGPRCEVELSLIVGKLGGVSSSGMEVWASTRPSGPGVQPHQSLSRDKP